ncbi:MAG: ankyrin repeat domain-containing protein [Amoebophilaceae bacterium]|nr:ankyrin repeat domain-containing protein [Amoebophilaceae bacterium]
MIHYSRAVYAIFMSFSLLQSCNHVGHKMHKEDTSSSENKEDNPTADNGLLLLEAVAKSYKTAAEQLLTKVDLHTVRDRMGNTPLHLVKDPAIAQMLIDAKAYLEAKNIQLWTPLYTAADSNHIAIMKALLQAGAEVNNPNDWKWTPLHAAIQSEHIAAMKLLIANKADLHAEANLGFSMQDGKITPLHLAALFGKKEALKLLIDSFDKENRKAALNAQAIRGLKPLDMAALSCNKNFRAIFCAFEGFFNKVEDAQECINYLEHAGADTDNQSYQALKRATAEDLDPLARLFSAKK